MPNLRFTEKSQELSRIVVNMEFRQIEIKITNINKETKICLTSSASQIIFEYTSQLNYSELIELPVQNAYNEIYKEFQNIFPQDSNYYPNGEPIPYAICQAYKAYRRNLPELNLSMQQF